MRLFTTEAVSKYHPDKYADQISDAILTECLKQDTNSRCGIETLVKDRTVVVAGEICTTANINIEYIVHRVADKLGYKVDEIINLLGNQSPEINQAVTGQGEICAGDQGIMYGYATAETDSMLPATFDLANRIIRRIESDVETNPNTLLKGDAKTQVTVDLDTGKVITVVVSACHHEDYGIEDVRLYINYLLLDLVSPEQWLINPAGAWTIGGPEADCGLTGRKIVCDQYGGACPVGGGAFSGKDPSKVDRTATYMARKIACELVKKFGLSHCLVQLGYVIGEKYPVSVSVESDSEEDLSAYICQNYDLSVDGMIAYLGLYDLDYERLAEGCHFFKNETSQDIRLERWCIEGNKVRLTYKDGTCLFVTKTDFDRAFGCIIGLTKEEAYRDFAIKL